MKTNRLLSIILAGTLAATAAVTASAQTLEGTFNDDERTGNTEVKARIEAGEPGEVNYIITIPDSVDFGTLQQPETDTDSNKYIKTEVTATKISNFSRNQFVEVHVKDSASTDDQFYITQKDSESPFKIKYDIYDKEVNDGNIGENTPLGETSPGTFGYHICSFGAGSEGQTQDMTLVLNQKAIYGQDLSKIAGDYSGTMVFHSAINTLGA